MTLNSCKKRMRSNGIIGMFLYGFENALIIAKLQMWVDITLPVWTSDHYLAFVWRQFVELKMPCRSIRNLCLADK